VRGIVGWVLVTSGVFVYTQGWSYATWLSQLSGPSRLSVSCLFDVMMASNVAVHL
jgi:hypothetical protein